ncbi:type IV pilus assembly protein FimV [Undibacterium sp. JH2W]|uniref:type IV pilus assembly protein FimV n=1 Tax=Undibacterium sp. JH2W TaxID=3413037 RepID=UPI003BF43674
MTVQSGLGQQLRAQLELTGNDAAEIEQSCFKAKVESPDGNPLAQINVNLIQKGSARYLTLVTKKDLLEPAVKIMVDMGCEIQLHREFLILLDPPFSNSVSPAMLASAPKTGAGDRPNPAVEQPTASAGPVVQKSSRRKEKPNPVTSEIVATPAETAISKKKPSRPTDLRTNPDKLAVVPKDTLKLSDDLPVLPQGLRLSEQLSVRAPQSNIEELRAAQAQLAAMLRDEKPNQISSEKLQSEQQKILSLQQEAQQLKRQSQLDKAALEEAKEGSFSRNWVMGLSVFIFSGLVIIGLLLYYVSRMRKKMQSTWWQQKEPASESESKKNIEEIVNSIQASYGPTTTSALYQVHDDEEEHVGVSRPVVALSKKTTADTNLGKLDAPSAFNKAYVPTLEDSNSSTFNFFSTKGQSVNVEEISDVTQEAEFWISVNDPQRAIEILEPQANAEQPESPVPWLYLLDLYRVTANKEKYDALRDRFIVFFNANIPEFEVDPATLPSRQLEDFEHLMNRICRMWSTNDILPFLESLLVDDRDGKRMGFELPVYRDILLLISVANELEKSHAFGGEKKRAWANVPGLPPDEDEISTKEVEGDSNLINFETIDFPRGK